MHKAAAHPDRLVLYPISRRVLWLTGLGISSVALAGMAFVSRGIDVDTLACRRWAGGLVDCLAQRRTWLGLRPQTPQRFPAVDRAAYVMMREPGRGDCAEIRHHQFRLTFLDRREAILFPAQGTIAATGENGCDRGNAEQIRDRVNRLNRFLNADARQIVLTRDERRQPQSLWLLGTLGLFAILGLLQPLHLRASGGRIECDRRRRQIRIVPPRTSGEPAIVRAIDDIADVRLERLQADGDTAYRVVLHSHDGRHDTLAADSSRAPMQAMAQNIAQFTGLPCQETDALTSSKPS